MMTWDENKRRLNLKRHGIDFIEVESVFDSPVYTEEDRTTRHSELRLRTLGLLRGKVVLLIWASFGDEGRIISCRYGDKHETRDYYEILFYSGRN